MAKTYYTLVMSRLTFAEYWRFCKGKLPLFLVAIVMFKILRVRSQITFAQSRLDAIVRDEPDKIPERVQKNLAGILAECEREGLVPDFYYHIQELTGGYSVGVMLKSPDPRILAQILYAEPAQKNIPIVSVFGCASRCSNGKRLITSGRRKELEQPPLFETENHPGASVRVILDRHRKRVEARADVESLTPQEIPDELVRINNLTVENFIRLGKYREMSEAEVYALKRKLGLTAD